MQDFVHLHVHTEYDLLHSPNRIDQLVRRAKELGMTALACTDRNTMYGVLPFYLQCKKEGVHPIIGLQVELFHDHERGNTGGINSFSLLLLAENNQGYKNLLQLSTWINTHPVQHRPLLPSSVLAQHHDGLIALSGGTESEVAQALLHGGVEAGCKAAAWYLQLFDATHFYLALQDHGQEIEKRINQLMLSLHRRLDIPLVTTNHVYYLQKEDALVAAILHAIQQGEHLQEKPDALASTHYLKSGEEMAALFAAFPQALANTSRIAARCQVELSFDQMILPAYPLPAPPATLVGEEWNAGRYLRHLCEQGVHRRYGTVTPAIRQRLEYELTVIERMGFADYFLIVWDFMRYAHEQRIMTGPGRGSAAGSLVAYVLSITDIDPLQHQLLFERFLNPERVTMPDIDIDFSDRRRDEMIDYVVTKYGKEHVAQIITFGTMAARAAIRDLGRVLDYPNKLVDRVAKLIPQTPGITLEQALKEEPRLQQLARENQAVARLIELAQQIEGLPRHVSTHAAGVVISEAPLTDYVPLQIGSDQHWLTQYPMDILERLGLLKMDFLGLRNLSLMEEVLEQVEQEEGTPLLLDRIPFDDNATFQLLSRGDTTGIFQLESEGMRHVLRELKPGSFEDVVAVLALYRPGPMENIPTFIKAKHGEIPITYPHPDLEPILASTYGIIVYQEQIMQIAATMAGFSLGEADLLRRAVSKKRREILDQERAHFVQGCLAKGYEEGLAHEVYDLIVRFADYGFNRSHSAAYAMLAYRLAYLKAHYAGVFMASLLSFSIGNQKKLAEYIDEVKRMGFAILPPDVNKSQFHFTFQGDRLRVGLAAIKNVGSMALQEIITKRTSGPYIDLADLCRRVDLRICNRRVLESLILCGAMDSFPGERTQLLALLDPMMEAGEAYQRREEEMQLGLFIDGERRREADLPYPELPPFTLTERLRYEKELLGFYVSGHPLDAWRHVESSSSLISMEKLEKVGTGERVQVLGLITQVKTITTKRGERMAFASAEGKFATVNLVLFPKVFAQFRQLCERERVLVIEGRVEQHEAETKIVVEQLYDPTLRLEQFKGKKSKEQHGERLFIRIAAGQEVLLSHLQRLLLANGGPIPVYLYYEGKNELRKLNQKYTCSGSTDLLDEIEQLLGQNSVILKKID